ncbi:MAG: hypothetical protein Kow006_02730 [Gammaproteobacteria bacterium]
MANYKKLLIASLLTTSSSMAHAVAIETVSVPEASSLALLGAGLVGLTIAKWRSRRK